jgi:hypothetical protein
MLAKSYWINWNTIKSQIELDKILEKVLYKKWTELLNIYVEQEENVFPMVPAWKTLWETILE